MNVNVILVFAYIWITFDILENISIFCQLMEKKKWKSCRLINGWRKLKENTMSEWRVSHQIRPPPESWKTRKVLIPYNENKRNQWRKKRRHYTCIPNNSSLIRGWNGTDRIFHYSLFFCELSWIALLWTLWHLGFQC